MVYRIDKRQCQTFREAGNDKTCKTGACKISAVERVLQLPDCEFDNKDFVSKHLTGGIYP